MTQEQQRIAIAEARGWTKIYKGPEPDNRMMTPDGRYSSVESTPDYPNERNAMHDAIVSLTPKQRLVFADTLNSLVPDGFYDDYYEGWVPAGASLTFAQSIFALVAAPTEIMAEAFLRTIGKWQ